MSAAAWDDKCWELLDHPGPWTEEEYLALPKGMLPRVELLDGYLLVSPVGSVDHQKAGRRLVNLLEAAAPLDWEVVFRANVRFVTSRILTPDVAIASRPGNATVLDADDVVLLGEVVSLSSVTTDHRFKPQLYASSGIPWYLCVELGRSAESASIEVTVSRLRNGVYVEHARARAGQVLRLDEPVPVAFDPARLLRR